MDQTPFPLNISGSMVLRFILSWYSLHFLAKSVRLITTEDACCHNHRKALNVKVLNIYVVNVFIQKYMLRKSIKIFDISD